MYVDLSLSLLDAVVVALVDLVSNVVEDLEDAPADDILPLLPRPRTHLEEFVG